MISSDQAEPLCRDLQLDLAGDPGSNPGEQTYGSEDSFDKARAAFERA